MKAIWVTKPGGPEVLEPTEVDGPGAPSVPKDHGGGRNFPKIAEDAQCVLGKRTP